MTNYVPVLGGLYHVTERQVDDRDAQMGVSRRFMVKNTTTGTIECVVIVAPTPGRWDDRCKKLCTCKSELDCAHRLAVDEATKSDPDEPPVAA